MGDHVVLLPREAFIENIQMTILGQTKGPSSLVSCPQQCYKQVPGMRIGRCVWYIL